MSETDRKFWLDTMLKIADPVLLALSGGRLKESLPLSFHSDRSSFAPLEAFGRLMCGIAPWIGCETLSGEEEALRAQYEERILRCFERACNPESPDYMNWGREGAQPLVDAAFLSHALVRAPRLIADMDPETGKLLVNALKISRSVTPGENNWLFFSAMVETALYLLGEPDYDMLRISYAVRIFYQDWYKGDGLYGDGKNFHWDYYNSFVIQPMYVDIVTVFADKDSFCGSIKPEIVRRAARYSSILERLISPEGTYPVIGRSIAYRFGAFQLLSQASLEHFLEEEVSPAQVRCALTAVIRKVIQSPEMFDENGWLRPGVYGFQPELAEMYINIGSLYLCTSVFLPLGLPPEDDFWSGADADWSAKKVWSGGHITIDHAI